MSAWFHRLCRSHRLVGLCWISASVAYCIVSKCQLCCSFLVVWSEEGEVEGTFEEAGGKLDGLMGGGRGTEMEKGVESVGPDAAPGDQR